MVPFHAKFIENSHNSHNMCVLELSENILFVMKLHSDICPWNHHMGNLTPIIKPNFRIKTRMYKWSFGWPIRDFLVFQFFIYMLPLNLLGLSNRFSEDISTPCYNVFCHFRTYHERWQWRFDFGSKVTIVSIYCLPLALCTI